MFFSQSLAALCAYLASAPFTPAIVAVGITLPLGIVGLGAGRWRTGFLAVYWSIVAFIAFFTLVNSSHAGDAAVLWLFALGALLSVGLLISFILGFRTNAELQ